MVVNCCFYLSRLQRLLLVNTCPVKEKGEGRGGERERWREKTRARGTMGRRKKWEPLPANVFKMAPNFQGRLGLVIPQWWNMPFNKSRKFSLFRHVRFKRRKKVAHSPCTITFSFSQPPCLSTQACQCSQGTTVAGLCEGESVVIVNLV